jgi:hypothetical protein
VGSEDRHPQALGQLTQLAFGWGGTSPKDIIERYYDRSEEVTTNNRCGPKITSTAAAGAFLASFPLQ